jgi:hypothetical protein
MDDHTKDIVAEIIRRIAQRLGADGTQGDLAVALSGATPGSAAAMSQLRGLVYDGYQLLIVPSDDTGEHHAPWVDDQLLGMPFVQRVPNSNWPAALETARAVVAPQLELCTAAKVSRLIAGTLTEKLILGALATGKPLIAAPDGDSLTIHRRWPAGGAATPAFRQSVLKCLKTIEDFGCRLVEVNDIRDEVRRILGGFDPDKGAVNGSASKTLPDQAFSFTGRQVVTAAHIRQAHVRGTGLRLTPGAIVTPLAKEQAARMGVKLVRS